VKPSNKTLGTGLQGFLERLLIAWPLVRGQKCMNYRHCNYIFLHVEIAVTVSSWVNRDVLGTGAWYLTIGLDACMHRSASWIEVC
jgi:hypothetical protein